MYNESEHLTHQPLRKRWAKVVTCLGINRTPHHLHPPPHPGQVTLTVFGQTQLGIDHSPHPAQSTRPLSYSNKDDIVGGPRRRDVSSVVLPNMGSNAGVQHLYYNPRTILRHFLVAAPSTTSVQWPWRSSKQAYCQAIDFSAASLKGFK